MRNVAIGMMLLLSIGVHGAETVRDSVPDYKPMMELQVGKIILYPERMGMTGSENLMTCLQSLPALVQKGTVDLLSNFTLEEDGDTYLQDPTIYLQQTQVSEVAMIEIITDGSVSDGLSGVMGIINVVMKTPSKGTHGHADILANTHGEFYPTVYASYRQGVFSAAGSVMGLFDRDKVDTYKLIGATGSSVENNKVNYRAEAFKVRFQWDLPNDFFLLRVSQLYSHDDARDRLESVSDAIKSVQNTSSGESDNQINCSFEYNHRFNYGGIFKAKVGVETLNNSEDSESHSEEGPLEDFETKLTRSSTIDEVYYTGVNWSALVKYQTPIASWMTLSVSLPMSWNSMNQNIYRQPGSDPDSQMLRRMVQETATNIYNPYFIMTINMGKHWNLKFGQRYMLARYSMTDSDNEQWKSHREALFMNVGLQYKPAEGHILQANYRHTAEIPSVKQLYPYRWFAQSPNIYYIGNDELKTSKYQVFDLGYSYSHNRLQLATQLQYYVNRDNIESEQVEQVEDGNITWKGWTSRNVGKVKTWDVNVSAVYSLGIFQAMAGANLYHQVTAHQDHVTWCCLRISPTVKLPKQWTLSAQVSYVSPQISDQQRVGKNYYGLVRVSKTWDFGLSLFAYWENFLNNDSLTTVMGSTYDTTTRIKYHENKLSIGISYRFL